LFQYTGIAREDLAPGPSLSAHRDVAAVWRRHQGLAYEKPFQAIQQILETFIKRKYLEFMSSLSDAVAASGFASRVIHDSQLADLLGGSSARRYGLVNRALADRSLIRLRRGAYVLAEAMRSGDLHPFSIAQGLVPGSYVSFESALSWHGWIPEAVFMTSSVVPTRKTIEIPTAQFGTFTFHPLAINRYQFFTGIDRAAAGSSIAFVARPLRALMDIVALRKIEWPGLGWVSDGMRIGEESLSRLSRADFHRLRPVYKHKAANAFLKEMEAAVMDLKRDRRTGSKP
jgi:hypothetical protein